MKSYIRKEDSLRFDGLVSDYIKLKDEKYLPQILESGMKIVKSIRLYYADLHLDEHFDKEMVLEFLFHYLGDRDGTSPTRSIRNISYTKIKEYIEEADTPRIETYDAYVYSVNVTSRLIFQESLDTVLKGLPLRIQAAILYLVYFPDQSSFLRRVHGSLIDYFVVLKGIQRLRTMVNHIHSDRNVSFHFKLPETQIARLLLVSSLYKVCPSILVLLMQEKNLNSIIQFCTLFGGQSVAIPTVTELQHTVEQASTLATRLEEGKLTIADQEVLTYLASDLNDVTELDPNMPLNPVLSSFFERILQITLKNYDDYQQRLIKGVDPKNLDDILRIYEVMNKELRTQVELLMKIGSSIDEREEIDKIIDILTHSSNNSN